ncbi:cytochrome-c peroxidase [Costertonia aggregata]|uniref:Cytochrome-c peroxidase n=1 Tax=Costertonia aggregata TaxID=343403 RepID=A0A7H9AMF3_9FLAO|nr:cytochrome c peroxidase [Costertonia aggregata]QLG44618.1 cytochrome-c peroxidase [Costertonia aggregata]
MGKISLKPAAYIFFLSFLFVGCNKEDNTYIEIGLDDELEETLVSIYGSLDGITLPNSDAYQKIPADPNNKITKEKVALGKLLFHETALATNPKQEESMGTYSCASCHHSKAGFQSGMKQGIGEGGIGFGFMGETRKMAPNYDASNVDVQPLRSPTILNTAYQDVMLWNGQFGATGTNKGTEAQWTIDTPKEKNNLGFQGLETQAIAGLGVHRLKMDAEMLKNNNTYKSLFDDAFPEVPENDRYSLINGALAIAAYERTVLASEAPFQKWLKGKANTMNENDKNGAILFFGKAKCYTCHSGPGLNGMDFHALGMADLEGTDVIGDIKDADKKGRGGFTKNPEDDYKFKTPTLYNLRDLKFLGHGGSFMSIKEVIEYKNLAIAQNNEVPSDKLSPLFIPLGLSTEEIQQLTSFVENSLYDDNLQRFAPESLPTGQCFPNADAQSKIDMDCN